LQLRVEQVLQGQLTPVLAYKLMNLLDFYSGTVSIQFLAVQWDKAAQSRLFISPRCYATSSHCSHPSKS
jgi:hypothetical protein